MEGPRSNRSCSRWPTPQPQQHQPDPSHVCDLYCSSQQCQIFNPLSEARDRTHNLMVPSQIRFWCTWRELFFLFFKCDFTKKILISYVVHIVSVGQRWSRLYSITCSSFLIRRWCDYSFFCFVLFFVFLLFLGPLPRHMEVPRLGVQSEL